MVNNFAQDHTPKFHLYFKWQASKVGTFYQNEDHVQNEFLHFNSKLNQTNTILLNLIYDYHPPKRIAKFKNIFLSGITTNTLQAW
jgi:hypothetical protein